MICFIVREMTASQHDVESLKRFLQKEYPNDVLIPIVPGEKRPLFAHKSPGSWSWQMFDDWVSRNTSCTWDIGILMKELCVIDVDSEQLVAELEQRFPVLQKAPMEKTRKGRHYFFCRSALADANGFYDARSPVIQGVDFKTITRHCTSGVVVVAPSSGKQWIRTPWGYTGGVPEIPDDVLVAVAVPIKLPVPRCVLQFSKGTRIVVNNSACVFHMEYIVPFLTEDESGILQVLGDGKDPVIPIPDIVSADDFVTLLVAAEYGMLPPERMPTTLATRDALASAGDCLGLPMSMLRPALGVVFSAYSAHRDMTSIHEEWANVYLEERWISAVHRKHAADDEATRFRCFLADGSDAVNADECLRSNHMVKLDGSVASGSKIDILRRGVTMMHDQRWLFHTWPSIICLDQTLSGDAPLSLCQDPTSAAEQRLPGFVVKLLRMFPEELVLAGGAALDACCSEGVLESDNQMDYDFFIQSSSRARAKEIVQSILNMSGVTPLCWSRTAITLQVSGDQHLKTDVLIVQVITRVFKTLQNMLMAFDMAPSKVAVFSNSEGALEFMCMPTFLASMRHMACWLHMDQSTWTRTCALRAFKYYAKGFEVFIPGLRRCALHRYVTSQGQMQTQKGIALLFAVEAHFVRSLSWRQRFMRSFQSSTTVKAVEDCSVFLTLVNCCKKMLQTILTKRVSQIAPSLEQETRAFLGKTVPMLTPADMRHFVRTYRSTSVGWDESDYSAFYKLASVASGVWRHVRHVFINWAQRVRDDVIDNKTLDVDAMMNRWDENVTEWTNSRSVRTSMNVSAVPLLMASAFDKARLETLLRAAYTDIVE